MSQQSDTQTLIESFSTLADAVQELIDRKTILEHKLRFAAEQYQQLADQHAVAAPEISETLANLQLPSDVHKPAVPSTCVPLPKRRQVGCSQHQIALLIRDGRRAAQHLSAARTGTSGGTGGGLSSKETASDTMPTSAFTAMEQDFTVEGKKGVLDCPFSAAKREQHLQRQRQQLEQQLGQQHQGQQQPREEDEVVGHHKPQDNAATVAGRGVEDPGDPTPHHSADPICAAMFEEVTSQPAPSSGGAVRCPIRFLDQHSPEEVAHYVETHKHQLPRSHAICLRRYNKNEEQVRKIDAKYGSLVNMISGLGQFHQPMMASGEAGSGGGGGGGLGVAGPAGVAGVSGDAAALLDQQLEFEAADRAALNHASHERVKTWAKAVSAAGSATDGSERQRHGGERNPASATHDGADALRPDENGDDYDDDDGREGHFARPLKEVRVGESPSRPWGIAVPVAARPDADREPPLSPAAAPVPRKCPFSGLGGGALASPHGPHGPAPTSVPVSAPAPAPTPAPAPAPEDPRPDPAVQQQASPPPPPLQPAFIGFPPAADPLATPKPGVPAGGGGGAQMVFTGPVFIGYPMEQAMQFMQQFQAMQSRDVVFSDARDSSSTVLGGLGLSGGITNASFHAMLRILVANDGDVVVQTADGAAVLRDDNPLVAGHYLLAADDGLIRLSDEHPHPLGYDGEPYYALFHAAHIVPVARAAIWHDDAFSALITVPPPPPFENESINSVQNGMMMQSTIHTLFDNHFFSILVDDNHKILFLGAIGCDLYNIAGTHLDAELLKHPERPPDELFRWHFKQTVLHNMRGAGEPAQEYDFPPGSDMVGTILSGPRAAERMEAELFRRLAGAAGLLEDWKSGGEDAKDE